MIFLFLFVASFSHSLAIENKTKLVIGGMFLDFDFLVNEKNILPAAQIAVDDINQAGILLPDYELELKVGITNCAEPLAVYNLNEMLRPTNKSEPSAIAVMGPICGVECDLTGPLMKM